jgi:hypothetical protein
VLPATELRRHIQISQIRPSYFGERLLCRAGAIIWYGLAETPALQGAGVSNDVFDLSIIIDQDSACTIPVNCSCAMLNKSGAHRSPDSLRDFGPRRLQHPPFGRRPCVVPANRHRPWKRMFSRVSIKFDVLVEYSVNTSLSTSAVALVLVLVFFIS